MNSYRINQEQSSFSEVLKYGIIATALMASPFVMPSNADISLNKVKEYTICELNHPTLTEKVNLDFNNFVSEEIAIESVVIDFFAKLSTEQEELEREFKSVLYDNIWDLYQS